MSTRLGLYGGPRAFGGDFSSKITSNEKEFTLRQTTHALYGGARGFNRDFSNKPHKTFTSIYTRLSLHGGPRGLYGNFVLKTPVEELSIVQIYVHYHC